MHKIYFLLGLLLLSACNKPTPIIAVIDKELETVVVESPLILPLTVEINANILVASRYIGYHESVNRVELRQFLGVDPVRIDWCAAFINSILKENNILGSDSVSAYPLTARSFLRWGKRVTQPELGDIIVFPRGTEGWQGHVGFYYGTEYINGIKHYLILGGNQNNAVTIEPYRAALAISIRRPK